MTFTLPEDRVILIGLLHLMQESQLDIQSHGRLPMMLLECIPVLSSFHLAPHRLWTPLTPKAGLDVLSLVTI